MEQKKEFLVRNVNHLSFDSKLMFSRFVAYKLGKLPQQSSEGILVNLDTLTDTIIDDLYNFLNLLLCEKK